MDLTEKLEKIIRAAAPLMQGSFRIEEKGGLENIVTSADIAVQEYLQRELSSLLPGCGFICEESDVHDPDHEYVWIIDPIDGTANFSRGIDHCSISVALKHNDALETAAVFSPARNEYYCASSGKGAFLNGKSIHVSSRSFGNSLFCTAMSTYRKEFADTCSDIIMETYHKCNDVRRFGSAAIELCFLAAGQIELYFEMRLQPWDYSAAMLILNEAGGSICNLDGNPPRFDGPDLVVAANSEKNLAELLSTVRKHIPVRPYQD